MIENLILLNKLCAKLLNAEEQLDKVRETTKEFQILYQQSRNTLDWLYRYSISGQPERILKTINKLNTQIIMLQREIIKQSTLYCKANKGKL